MSRPSAPVCIILTVACFLVLSARPSEGIQCTSVLNYMMPCASYLQSNGAISPSECCQGLQSLRSVAPTTKDRRDVCNCIMQYAGMAAGFNTGLMSSLPKTCGLPLSFVPSAKFKCSSIN